MNEVKIQKTRPYLENNSQVITVLNARDKNQATAGIHRRDLRVKVTTIINARDKTQVITKNQ